MAADDEFAEFAAGALPSLLRFGHILTGDRSAAEDLVQISLGRCLRAWRLRQIDDPQAFVRKIMVNRYATWHRRRWRLETAVADPPDLVAADDMPGRIDERDAMSRALLRLPPRQRAVIVLRYYVDLSEQEIAAVMGISPGTVKSQASRALRHLAMVLASPNPAVEESRGSRR